MGAKCDLKHFNMCSEPPKTQILSSEIQKSQQEKAGEAAI